jgi:hypothetical protein
MAIETVAGWQNLGGGEPREVATQIKLEHRLVGCAEDALWLSLEAEMEEERLGVWVERVVFLVDCLSRHIQRLFGIEESGQYLIEVADARPDLTPQVSALQSDHFRLCAGLSKLRGDLNNLDIVNLAHLIQLRHEIRKFLLELDGHKGNEIALIQEALLADLGGGG